MYWLNSNRRIERMHRRESSPKADTFTTTFGSGYWQIYPLRFGVLIEMDANESEGASLWYLPASQFLSANPVLIHTTSTVPDTHQYDRVWVEDGRIL